MEQNKTADPKGGDPGEEIKILRQELADEKNRHLRTLADFDNYRRRVERTAQEMSMQEKKALLLDLLALFDDFEQARKHINDAQTAEGLNLIYRRFLELLKNHGVTPIECLGRPFDPAEQEGVAYVETADCPEGCVAGEICRGFKFGEEILRPAKVLVARRPG